MRVLYFTHPATTEIYTLSLHDALPISRAPEARGGRVDDAVPARAGERGGRRHQRRRSARDRRARTEHQDELRSEEHTSELQSLRHLVCRLLLEKKKK